jgi:hypothetical protein
MVASLVFSQAALAAGLGAMGPGSSGRGDPAPPCHSMVAEMGAIPAAPDHEDDRSPSMPCPMMNGAICVSLCAAGVPVPGALLVAVVHGATPLAWFEPRGFTGSIVDPPQRPPKAL